MSGDNKVDPGHDDTRDLLRLLGILLTGAGLLLTLIGLGSFFAAFGGSGFAQYFWCAFLGLPLLGVGLNLCRLGFQGAIARYQAGEVAPVAKDAINYLSDGAQEGVKTVATAVGEGLASGFQHPEKSHVHCPKCNLANDSDARFCKHCGTALAE